MSVLLVSSYSRQSWRDNVQPSAAPAEICVMPPHLHRARDQLHAQDQHEHRHRHHVREEES